MADLDKYSGSRKRNGDGDGDGDDRSRNRIRKGRRLLEFFNSDFEVEENASSDVENNNKSLIKTKPTDTIANVKDKIKIKEGIRVDEQVLIFNERILGDDGTLFDFHIHAKSILTLMHKSRGFMQILIKTPTKETITLEVKPSYTIYSIKRKIKDQVHIPCDEQELSFDEKVLRNINTLSDFNINKGSTLTLAHISSGFMQIFIKTLTETTFTLDVQRLNTIKSIKTRIQDNVDIHNVNIPCDEQELIFNEMLVM
ncbi:hypothetical protein E3N88_14583 [Mikania micrantha]|uniref:Ubiquitin-like domain-containing protein n=1 Tax=Mikania micrantha TaxID=192012 RepID=A0A5N6P3T1_9ASTR|nr:hypothetical protein E3N88_14583 [Mikania micrantha]